MKIIKDEIWTTTSWRTWRFTTHSRVQYRNRNGSGNYKLPKKKILNLTWNLVGFVLIIYYSGFQSLVSCIPPTHRENLKTYRSLLKKINNSTMEISHTQTEINEKQAILEGIKQNRLPGESDVLIESLQTRITELNKKLNSTIYENTILNSQVQDIKCAVDSVKPIKKLDLQQLGTPKQPQVNSNQDFVITINKDVKLTINRDVQPIIRNSETSINKDLQKNTNINSSAQSINIEQNPILDSGNSIPDSGNSIPDSVNSIPDSGNSIPDSGNSIPDSDNSIPDSGNSIPDSGNSIPDSHNYVLIGCISVIVVVSGFLIWYYQDNIKNYFKNEKNKFTDSASSNEEADSSSSDDD